MSIIREFTLYLHAGITTPEVIHANQYSQGETWIFKLLQDDGSVYVPSTGALIGVKADGHAIAGLTGTVLGDGRVSITTTQQLTAAAGDATCELTIDGGTNGSANFVIRVEKKPTDDAILSESDLSIIQEGMNSVTPVVIAETVSDWLEDNLTDPPIDPSLSISNAAADAKVTGDKITELKTEIEKIATFSDYANIFDKSSVVPNKTLVAGSGETYDSLADSDILSVSPIIPVEGGNSYTGSSLLMGNSARIFAYYENGSYAGGLDGVANADGSYTYQLVDAIKYVRFRYTTSLLDIDSYMFVKGTVLPSEYVPYGKYLSDGELLDVKNELETEINTVDSKVSAVDIRNVLYKVPNTIDDNGFTNGAFVNGNTGELVSVPAETTFWCSDYTEIVGGANYYYSHDDIYAGRHMAFYDADKNYISGYETTIPNPFPTPENAKYVRFLVVSSSVTKAKNAWLNIIDEAPEETAVKYAFDKNTILAVDVENPCDYNGNEITVFNKIMCIGDSITAGTFNHNEGGSMQYEVDARYSYPTYLTKLCGVETLNNGVGGYTSVRWWNSRQSADFSGYDCAIINLGINDALQNVSASDTTTALENIINALKTANEGIKIFLATIVPAYSDGTTQFDAVNETIRNVAEDNNCYLIDLSEYSHARKGTVSEAGHLTAWGYYRLAKDYISAISYIMNENRTAFKFVQFIGTDYVYNA